MQRSGVYLIHVAFGLREVRLMRISVIAGIFMVAAFHAECRADPPEEAMRFLTVPDSDKSLEPGDPQTFEKSSLPKDVVAILEKYDWGTDDRLLPSSLVGYLLDLNKDGKAEYFIRNIRGGSAGPGFFVLSKWDGAWRVILDFMGVFHAVPVKGGWPRVVTTSKGGGNTFSKVQHVFEGNAYRATVLERYDGGTITREVIPKDKG